jgi:hypothetical protein
MQLDASRTIVLYADPDTREVEIHFPTPEGGILTPEPVSTPDGRKEAVLRIQRANQEQRAHYVFWSNGTEERINSLKKDGRGAGLRQTLQWLLSMRIKETFERTGWRYVLVTVSNKRRWRHFKATGDIEA